MLPQLTVQPTLAWYPSRLGWRFDVSRAQLRGKDWEGADAPTAPAAAMPSRRHTRIWCARRTSVASSGRRRCQWCRRSS